MGNSELMNDIFHGITTDEKAIPAKYIADMV